MQSPILIIDNGGDTIKAGTVEGGGTFTLFSVLKSYFVGLCQIPQEELKSHFMNWLEMKLFPPLQIIHNSCTIVLLKRMVVVYM